MTLKKHLLPVLASVSLFAAACGGAADTEAASADSGDAATTTEAVERTEGTEQVGDVLAVALQSIEDTSYSFEQGVRIEVDAPGESVSIGGEDAFITGQVDGGEAAINADIGSFMRSTFESLNVGDASDPFFEGILSSFDALQMNVWTTDDAVVMDLSDFGPALGLLDPSASDEFALFSDGPVSIDLERLAELSGDLDVSAGDLASQFGGAQVLDPSALVDALESIEELEAAGTDSVNGIAVDVYEADVSFADYAESIGQDVFDDLDGLSDEGVDAEALGEVEVDITLMVDAEGLVRQIVTSIDTGGFGADSGAIPGSLVTETWQTFDNYGETFDIVVPDAVDVTDEIADQLGS